MGEPAHAVSVVLYRASPRWGLPSLSPASIQVEAYLRMAGIKFSVRDCATASGSPTGTVPAIDTSAELVGAPADDAEARGGALLIEHLRSKLGCLDRDLTANQKAQLLAFTALLDSRIVPAVLYTTWCEPGAYKYTREAYGDQLAWPLSYLLPRSQRKLMHKRFAGDSASQIYGQAAAALGALSAHLASAGSGPYFLGAQPTSLDALLYGVLEYLKVAPVVHPELRQKVTGSSALTAYTDRIASRHFASTVPSAAAADINWSQTQGSADWSSKQKTAKDAELQRKGWLWLAGAAVVIAGYVLLQGDYIQLVVVEDEEEGPEDE